MAPRRCERWPRRWSSSPRRIRSPRRRVEPVYRAAERWNAFDDKAFGNKLVELPGDVVQLYVRDPPGYLVEIDHYGVELLPDELRGQLKGLWDFNPQSEENMRGRLFMP